MYPRFLGRHDLEMHEVKKDQASKKELKAQPDIDMVSFYNAINVKKLATLEKIFQKLTPKQIRMLILKRNENGITAFHHACQYGNKEILAFLTERIHPMDLYFLRNTPLFPSYLAGSNRSLTMTDFEEIMRRHNSVFDVFDYHVRNRDREDKDIQDRRHDTRERAKCFTAKLLQPLPDERFAAKKKGLWTSSQEYYDLCHAMMRYGTLQEYRECEAFFTNANLVGRIFLLSAQDKEIIESLFDRGPEATQTEVVADKPLLQAEDFVSPLSKPIIGRSISYIGPTEEAQVLPEKVAPSALAISSFLTSRVPDRDLEVKTEKKAPAKLTALTLS